MSKKLLAQTHWYLFHSGTISRTPTCSAFPRLSSGRVVVSLLLPLGLARPFLRRGRNLAVEQVDHGRDRKATERHILTSGGQQVLDELEDRQTNRQRSEDISYMESSRSSSSGARLSSAPPPALSSVRPLTSIGVMLHHML